MKNRNLIKIFFGVSLFLLALHEEIAIADPMITFRAHILLNRAGVDSMPGAGIAQNKFIAYFQATNTIYSQDSCEIEGHGQNFGEGTKDGQRVYEADVLCVRHRHRREPDIAPPPLLPPPLPDYRPLSYICRMGGYYQVLPVFGMVGSQCYMPGWNLMGFYSSF